MPVEEPRSRPASKQRLSGFQMGNVPLEEGGVSAFSWWRWAAAHATAASKEGGRRFAFCVAGERKKDRTARCVYVTRNAGSAMDSMAGLGLVGAGAVSNTSNRFLHLYVSIWRIAS